MSKLTFITGNAKKAEALANYFHMPVEHIKLDLPEVQSLDVEEIAKGKAKAAYAILQTPVLVEDAALTFEALNGLPGPLVRWFLDSIGNEGMCKLLDVYTNRNAVASVCFAYCDENGVEVFKGETAGTIVEAPKGEMGFGFDPIFKPEGEEKTWGEMTKEDMDATSMRKKALTKLTEFLSQKS